MSYLNTIIGEDPYRVKIKSIWLSYDEIFPENELIEMGNLILSNPDYEGEEYRFLCWLFSKGLLENPGLTLPFIPEIATLAEYNEAAFKAEFLFNQQRTDLFDAFEKWLDAFKVYISTSSQLTVLIGGSFTELDNDRPGDIDGIVLVPQQQWYENKIRFMNSYVRKGSAELDIKQFDFKLLPDNFNLDQFKGYNDIWLLANKPEVRDEDGRLFDNEFKERKIVKLII